MKEPPFDTLRYYGAPDVPLVRFLNVAARRPPFPPPPPPSQLTRPLSLSQDVDNEHFIVWMRPAALPTFRKLYAVINEALPAGDYQMLLNSSFPTASFGGTKTLVLSNLGWTGGKNLFLAGAFLVVGSISFALAIVCLLAWVKGRQMGSAAELVWQRRQ
jgi:hypothetical protein